MNREENCIYNRCSDVCHALLEMVTKGVCAQCRVLRLQSYVQQKHTELPCVPEGDWYLVPSSELSEAGGSR